MSALGSLYGDGHAAAVRAKECVAMPGRRNQVVCTPPAIVEGLRRLWPEGVALDPCHGEGSIVGAARTTSTRGLLQPWPHRTYANPPYGASLRDPERDGEAWAAWQAEVAASKARGEKPPAKPPSLKGAEVGLDAWLRHQLTHSEGESVLLVPNRTHRKWLRAWRREVDGLVELDPLAFLGHVQAFPAPLVLGFVCRLGADARPGFRAERVRAFHLAFSVLGDPA